LLRIFSNMFTVCYRLKILSASLLFKFNQIKPVLYIRWCVWDCSLIFFNENLIFFQWCIDIKINFRKKKYNFIIFQTKNIL